MIGGWQVTGIYQRQSGEPLTITSGRDNAGWGLGSNRAIHTGQPFEAPAARTRPSGSTLPLSRSTRTARSARQNVASSSARGTTVDLGLFKNFRFTNDMNIQFRAEFFNLFNTVNFGNPGTTVSSQRASDGSPVRTMHGSCSSG